MNINDKVMFVKPVREYCVLKAKTGQTGTITMIDGNSVSVELANGEVVRTVIDKIELYTKKERFGIKTCSNEELIDKFEEVQKTIHYGSIGTKTWDKANRVSKAIREELLLRMYR